ncbi:dihydrofolate reductase family protein [Geodermatophilus sp. SYSU D00700]
MQLTMHAFLSLDGVMQGPGGAEEDASGRFTRGGWSIPYFDDSAGQIASGWFTRADEILLGRTTYEMMRGYWSTVDEPDNVVATALNTKTKHLVTSTQPAADWSPTHLIMSDPLDAIAELKKRPGGELQVHGSLRLARTLHEAGLIDEYRLLTFPVVVGQGRRLFDTSVPSGFAVVETSSTAAGATYSALRPTPFATAEVHPEREQAA